MSSKHQDYLAQYYGGGPQEASDFEPAKPKRKKIAKAAVKPLQGFKMIDDSEEIQEFEDFSSGKSEKKTELFIDYSADTKRRELMEALERPSGPADLTPPRRPRATRISASESATNNSHETTVSNVSGDLSPPRRARPSSTNGDLSPPRRGRSAESDLSPPRKPSEGEDLSPPRRRVKEEEPAVSGTNLSPLRRPRNPSDDTEVSKVARTMSMMDGGRAGLQTGAEITAEARRQREAEKSRLAEEAANLAEQVPIQTVYRDQHGRKIVQALPEEEEERERRFPSKEGDIYDPTQKVSRSSTATSDTSSTYLRSTEDKAEARRMDRDRWDDPLQRLKATGAIDSDNEDDFDFEDPMRRHKKRKRDGKPKTKSKEWLSWFPPNRFNIRPGAQWDGVDRSNGFEQKMYQAQLDRTHRAEQSYRYTSSDL